MRSVGSLVIGLMLVASHATAQTTAAVAPPTMTVQFGAASIPLLGKTALVLTVTNPASNAIPLTGVGFTDNLPFGLVITTPVVLNNGCNATVAVDPDDSSNVTLFNATLPINGSCSVGVQVQGTTVGIKSNSVTATSNEGGTGPAANALLTVLGPPTVAKAFANPSIVVGGTTKLTFTLQNTNATGTLTGIGLGDTLPTGVLVATPNGLTGGCGGGTISAPAGGAVVSLVGAVLSAGVSCNFSVDVTGTTPGFKGNLTDSVTSIDGGTGNSAFAFVDVVVPPELNKDFAVTVIPVGRTTTLTFTLDNNNEVTMLTEIAFTDTLPAGLIVATPNNLTDTCAGSPATAVEGTADVSVSGKSLGAGSTCTILVDVIATTTGQKINNTGNITALETGFGGIASAVIKVVLPFTDNPLVAGVTPIKAVHITELRDRIDALRSRYMLGAYSYADPTIVVDSTTIAAQHVLDLRAALDEVYAALFLPAPIYMTPDPAPNGNVLLSNITDLRAKIIEIE